MRSAPNNITAIILAAGRSSRMGRNKLLLPFRESSVLGSVVQTALSAEFREIIVVTGHDAENVIEHLREQPVLIIHNPEHTQGMASSIRAGVHAADTAADGIIIFLGDMPFISGEIIRTLIAAFYRKQQSAIVVPVWRKRRGNPVIFAKKYREELLQLEGDCGARPVVEAYPENVIEVPVTDERLFFDLDSWEDYEELVK